MTYTLHVTVNYPEGEEVSYTHNGIAGFYKLANIAENALREPSATSWVFVVTKEPQP